LRSVTGLSPENLPPAALLRQHGKLNRLSCRNVIRVDAVRLCDLGILTGILTGAAIELQTNGAQRVAALDRVRLRIATRDRHLDLKVRVVRIAFLDRIPYSIRHDLRGHFALHDELLALHENAFHFAPVVAEIRDRLSNTCVLLGKVSSQNGLPTLRVTDQKHSDFRLTTAADMRRPSRCLKLAHRQLTVHP
jgi:hypothetical protein